MIRFYYIPDIESNNPDLNVTTRNSQSNYIFNSNGAGRGFYCFYLVGVGEPVRIDRGYRYFLPFLSVTYIVDGREYSWDLLGAFTLRGEMFENNYSLIRVYRYATGAGPVSEPETWMMMIIGFGGIGAAMRRGHVGASCA